MQAPVKRPSAAEIYEQLREMILNFDIYPGSRITESELATQFGVSRTPIREALQRLEQEGHISIRTKQGCFVRQIDVGELRHFYRVRVALEKLSLENAMLYMADADLHVLAERWDPALQRGRCASATRMEALDESFHLALAEGGGNAALGHYLRDINNHIRVIRRLDFTDDTRIDRTYQEHYDIVQHLLRRDLDSATQLMCFHINRSEEFAKHVTLEQLARRRRKQPAGEEPSGAAADVVTEESPHA